MSRVYAVGARDRPAVRFDARPPLPAAAAASGSVDLVVFGRGQDQAGDRPRERLARCVFRIRLVDPLRELLGGGGLDEGASDLLRDDLIVILLDLHALRRGLHVILGEVLGEIVADARRTVFGIGHEGGAVVGSAMEALGHGPRMNSVGISVRRLGTTLSGHPSLLPSKKKPNRKLSTSP